ncbi:hypothetical protein MMC07_005750 [Pseudocyphellaria aurata]|nr:hypothetical protein [Pseudocyphellaria aurata]
MSAPTFINLPPPPADPVTPSDLGPYVLHFNAILSFNDSTEFLQTRGTPNSGTTSMSALSTTAIKDGHQGHAPPHTHTRTTSSGLNSVTNTLDAERADRISRLAGLERVATLRGTPTHLAPVAAQQQQQPLGYFDNSGYQQAKERSTVGSASATGSAGGRTTWASGSDMCEADKMSEDHDDGVSSSASLSDEGNASLVDFGEAASSTVSGPDSRGGMTQSASGIGYPLVTKPTSVNEGSPMQGVQGDPPSLSRHTEPNATAGMTDISMTGQVQVENIVGPRLDAGERDGRRAPEIFEEEQELGRFYFERK